LSAGFPIVGSRRCQQDVAFTAAIGSETKETAAAKALIEYLKCPAAVAIIKSKGMNPS
jgi:molybdate transport system substrate-binding protein